MSTNSCPDPETLAVFALGDASGEEWRGVVRHLADCPLCRRQVALVADEIPADLPRSERIEIGTFPARTKTWHRIAQGVAAAALIAAAVAWALYYAPKKNAVVDPPPQVFIPRPQPEKAPDPVPPPLPPKPHVVQAPDKVVPAPNDRPAPAPVPFPPSPVHEKTPTPAPSPFLAQRARNEVAQAIEITAGDGTVSRRAGEITTPLSPKTTIQPSDTLISPAGGSVVLADGSTIHLAPETEVRLSWNQALSCTTVDVRKGDAVVDLGKTPKPVLVTNGPVGVHLRESQGRLCVSAQEASLRATPLTGQTQFVTTGGDARRLGPQQSLVLGDKGDLLETAQPDVSRFVTLDAVGRGAPPPAPAPTPLPPDKRPPLLDVLVTALGAQSYEYRVSGRQIRDGVWNPNGLFTSTIEEFTAARKLDDKDATHVRKGSRAWDDLGKGTPTPRDARLVEILRAAQAPHQMILDLVPSLRGETAPRTEKVRDRICLVWDVAMEPATLRPFMERLLESAVAEGRLEKPDVIHWDTLEGSLEAASVKFEPRLLRLVDRRKVSYSYKTVGGIDRRTYHLETVYEFFRHGVAILPLPPEMIKDMGAPKK
jgi:hypothetical protein